ncbi:MAG: PepSY domain-containing protein [Oligoflexales bacterium]|nr:PepSY domain-containing protein [Oligoflexales bacterium]
MPSSKALCFLLGFWLCTSRLSADSPALENSYHPDGRPKLILQPEFSSENNGKELVSEYILSQINVWVGESDLVNEGRARSYVKSLKFESVTKSLLGTHYHYQQTYKGNAMEGSELIVSLLGDEKVYMVYTTLRKPGDIEMRRHPNRGRRTSHLFDTILTEEQALDIAWEKIKVHGQLFSKPTSELIYDENRNDDAPLYKVLINTAAPEGSWAVYLDAQSGETLSIEDLRIHRYKANIQISQDPGDKDIQEYAGSKLVEDVYTRFRRVLGNQSLKGRKRADSEWRDISDDYQGPIWDRRETTGKFLQKEHKDQTLVPASPTRRLSGSALVFDPNPRATLRNAELVDSSPDEMFSAAYILKPLRELSFDGELYRLNGPWIKIVDFSPPNVEPSTSLDGKWTAKRGNNAFNDVMTYYHIDNNQRYVQSLGFRGDRGVQNRAIEVDSYGTEADNSFFDPLANRIAFGHGCVDDNEDADVILHEYAHALEFGTNKHLRGGDSGSIGEGFGDYWAASYRSTTDNGDFERFKVFPWDASAGCWPGRYVNKVSAKYDPDMNYPAHGSTGTFSYDELWSTPLFQAFLTLTSNGVAKIDVDKAILQSFFGLGMGMKMREAAKSIVLSASMLFEDQAVANEFRNQFKKHNIL